MKNLFFKFCLNKLNSEFFILFKLVSFLVDVLKMSINPLMPEFSFLLIFKM